MAALAPRPSAMVSTAKNVKPGLRRRTRPAYRRILHRGFESGSQRASLAG